MVNEEKKIELEILADQIIDQKKQNAGADVLMLEKRINELVYELYDLTEEEIKIIEEN